MHWIHVLDRKSDWDVSSKSYMSFERWLQKSHVSSDFHFKAKSDIFCEKSFQTVERWRREDWTKSVQSSLKHKLKSKMRILEWKLLSNFIELAEFTKDRKQSDSFSDSQESQKMNHIVETPAQ